ncbi:AN1 zinc finger protein-like protein [Zopfia rhizophila CBS 207.26]|uniref:AN1 zinc finger protein-like protein n=1 Tax=Zopfia rhizophila CBS 207.26 TaxID=1314779 RepID=A0A6A6DUH3_9PEZI|nr:AN1 zinc finger protein-like protein [Zopfia rhizophila CBS 207.26]
MTSPTSLSTPSAQESHIKMSKGDVEAIGAHCQMEYCHVLDFLPFPCESCKGTFCLDHRTETAHKCPKAGEWARKRNGQDKPNDKLPLKPSLLNHDQQCADPSCKTLINTSRMPPNHCTTCNREYCLKHRMGEDHNCKNLKPLGARPMTVLEQQRQKGLSALAKLKAWSANKRAEEANKKKLPKFGFSIGKSSSNAAAAQALAELNTLKKAAKGEASVPQGKRLYLHVEASADTTKAKYPTGKFFYNKEWSVGRVLDAAAKALQVENVNNRGGSEEDKLRVFHVEGGRLLRFNEKIGETCSDGNMIVLLRGVGDPDLIDL